MANSKGYKILIVDDESEYLKVFSYILNSHGYGVITSPSAEAALADFTDNEVDLVMTDLKMPGMDGLELIKQLKIINPDINIMVITAFGTIESAVQAMKYGASGYFIKGSDPESLIVEIDKLYKIKELQLSNNILKQNAPDGSAFLSTKSAIFSEVLNTCEKAAKADISVLLLGESGVGKEVMAKFIHKLSSRKDNHFIPVNCQAFADGMIESELFGHEKGAFTGALEKRTGRFEEANKGTLFLDEIGDLSPNTQSKLLRALESRTIERVGSNKTIELDIRLVSATNKSLQTEIEQGRFREDLLYRINTLEITIPPLRQRKEDLPSLIDFFISIIEKDQKKKILSIDNETMEYLLSYDYPGNIRELKNIIERLVALSENGIIKGKRIGMSAASSTTVRSEDENAFIDSLRYARAEFEKQYIEQVLKNCDGDVTAAADVLKITKRQLWNKISEYHIAYKK